MILTEVDDLGADKEWLRLWRADDHQHANYTVTSLAVGAAHYTRLYYLPAERDVSEYRPCAERFVPHHLLASGPDGPVAGLALTVEVLPGRHRLSAYGRPLMLVEDRTAPARLRRQAAAAIHTRIQELTERYGAERYHARDYLVGGEISPLTEVLLRHGGVSRHHFTQTVDLRPPAEERFAELRKNFRKILRRDRGGFALDVVTARDVTRAHLDDFVRLHLEFFGKTLRTRASWDSILASVRADEGFMVIGRQDDRPVAMAYFAVSDRYCLYASGVNDADSYGSGLSHRVLWRAMEHARALGCVHFELGEQLYPGMYPDLPEKFRAIGHFKAGFSNTTAARLDVFSAPLEAP
ncbi:GNAT family N-acetyltransferase [Streptomyces sp. NBC_00019]|uniref:GNAT family N-acetyltransferase n=1 Tax=Streptomyces sp. NBC_00019 TaxID=2975623 RepID=UPI003250501E